MLLLYHQLFDTAPHFTRRFSLFYNWITSIKDGGTRLAYIKEKEFENHLLVKKF
jgi:hypothetical protein